MKATTRFLTDINVMNPPLAPSAVSRAEQHVQQNAALLCFYLFLFTSPCVLPLSRQGLLPWCVLNSFTCCQLSIWFPCLFKPSCVFASDFLSVLPLLTLCIDFPDSGFCSLLFDVAFVDHFTVDSETVPIKLPNCTCTCYSLHQAVTHAEITHSWSILFHIHEFKVCHFSHSESTAFGVWMLLAVESDDLLTPNVCKSCVAYTVCH